MRAGEWNDQHRTPGVTGHSLCYAADHGAAEACATVTPDDQQIRASSLSSAANLVGRGSDRYRRPDLRSVLESESEPSGERVEPSLRVLAAILLVFAFDGSLGWRR